MDVSEALLRNRSYRRFRQDERITREDLLKIVDAARLCPSGMNIQPLKFFISCDDSTNSVIFRELTWAAFLTQWEGPAENERPTGYIVILHDTSVSPSYFCNDGIVAQSMMLRAVELGFGGCMIASVRREKLSEALGIPQYMKIVMVLALGKPDETVVLEEMKENNFKYYRDENDVHHVPKRSLDELIINI